MRRFWAGSGRGASVLGALAEQGEAGSGHGRPSSPPCPANAVRALLSLCGQSSVLFL
jgi:hypothetical protein